MNLTDFHTTPPHAVHAACVRLAAEAGVRVTGSEIVGLVPLEALLMAGRHFLMSRGRPVTASEEDLVNEAINGLGLNDLYPFVPREKVLEFRLSQKTRMTARPIQKE